MKPPKRVEEEPAPAEVSTRKPLKAGKGAANLLEVPVKGKGKRGVRNEP